MKRMASLFWLAGLALLIALVGYYGFAEIGGAVAVVGGGIVAVCLLYPLSLIFDTWCWRILFPPHQRPSFASLLSPRWISDAVNTLLPATQVGGDLVRARLLTFRGVSASTAGASVVADITAAVASQIVFTLMGVALLMRHEGVQNTLLIAAAGIALFTALSALFYLAQHAGLFRRLAGTLAMMIQVGNWEAIIGGASALDDAIVETYRRRRDFLLACAWRLLGWLAGVLEVWLALYFLGYPVSLAEALLLESLSQAIRHAAFIVPGGLGVQEGAFILLGSLVGLGPETGLALSLVKRVRELLLGLPALLLWQLLEGRRVLHRKTRDS